MGILSRQPRTERPPRPARAARVRVRLRPEEIRETNRLTSLERKIGFGLALYGPAATVLSVQLGDSVKSGTTWIVVAALLGAVYAFCAKRTNRMLLGLVGLSFTIPMQSEPLLAYPFLGFMMFLMFRQSGERRKMMEAKAASGDIGPAPVRRRKEPEAPAVDGTGRAIPLPSKRYTPPKHRARSSAKKP
jgi:hypothetical protein